MLHIVVRRLANGVDRIKLAEAVDLAIGPPPHPFVPIDPYDPRIRDLIRVGATMAGVEPPTDAVEDGATIRDGERTHLYVWWRPRFTI